MSRSIYKNTEEHIIFQMGDDLGSKAGGDLIRFLDGKFLEWQVESGYRRTQTEFAKYLGVAPGTLSHWMNGIRKPDYENCLTLSKKLGAEVFDICGYIRPDPQLRKLIGNWDNLTPEAKKDILEVAGVSHDEATKPRSRPTETDQQLE